MIESNIKATKYGDESERHGFINTYLFSVFLLCQAYSGLYIYFGAKFMAIFLLCGSWVFTPVIYFLNKKRFFNGAKILLIATSILYVSASRIGIKEDLMTEIYCIPAIMMTLFFFDIRQTFEIFFGCALSMVTWIYLRWGPVPSLSDEFYPINFPAELFRTSAFVGAAALSGLFSIEFGRNVLGLKNSLEKELLKAKETEKVLESAQQMAKIGSWELDLKTRAIRCSKEQLRLYQMDDTSSEPLHDQYRRRLHPENSDSEQKMLQKIMETKKPHAQETRIILNSGEEKCFWSYAEPVFDKNGDIVKLIGLAQDITERKAQELDLLTRQIKMAQNAKLASIGEMAAGVAHEINNPLMIIHGKISHILRSLACGSYDLMKISADLNKVISTTDRIAKIVRGLRTMGRVTDSDPMEIANLKNVVDEVLDFSRERLKNAGVELKINLPMTLEVECRPAELGQVILNLINNAFDAIHEMEERWIDIIAKDFGENIEILVVDSGHGIPAHVVEKLMNPFFTTKEVGKGTGLGLSIALGIMKNHHGGLRYQEENNHTCFAVSLPKLQPVKVNSSAAAGLPLSRTS